MHPDHLPRREFLPRAAAALAGFTILPRHVLGGRACQAPSDKLNIAGVGVGAMGGNYLRNCESENIVALCDVDFDFASKTFQRYPTARTYRDYRKLLETEKNIDAVIIGTPDHTHAVVGIAALQLRKHLYCAKPLTRTLAEVRALARAAREAQVATQMSVQSCASEASAAVCDWIWSGAIGAVREVHVWSNRPIWPQGCLRPKETPPAPASLDWDLWLGPAPARPYHPAYHPFSWRGWWDFGTGALGDMACHAFHTIFRALKLGHPARVHASSSFIVQTFPEGGRLRPRAVPTPESAPMASLVTWDFPAREGLPPLRMTWYDGGIKPPRPPELPPSEPLRSDGVLYLGNMGVLLSGFSGGPRLLPEEKMKALEPPPRLAPRTTGHYQEWIAACKGGPPAHCHFDFGSLLTETALLGVAAIRTGKDLLWDAANARFTNDPEANQYLQPPYRAGWSL